MEITRDIVKRLRAEERIRETESLFRTIFEQAAVGVAQLNSVSGVILKVNRRYREILSTSKESLVGKTWMDLTHPDDLAADLANMERLRAGEIREFSMEKRLQREDGSFLWVHLTVSPMWQPGQEPSTHIAIVQDITARKQAEENLRSSELRFRRLVAHAPDAIVLMDVESGRFVQVNPAAERLFKRSAEQLCQCGPAELSPPKQPDGRHSAEKSREVIARACSGDTPIFEWTHCDAQGRNFPCEVRLLSLELGGRKVLRGSITDITHRKEAETALRELNASLERRVAERTAELEETNADLSAFAHSVSHDLRAPLRAMEGFAAALAEDYGQQLDENAREYIQHIADAAKRMDQLVDDLLAYSQLGHREFHLHPIGLNLIVQEALNQIWLDVKARDVELHVAEEMPKVLGHKATLVQVAVNLLSNGMKFVAQGVRPKLHVWAEMRNENAVRLWIVDNGIGIDDECQDCIFSLFERLHGIESYPGTGIGLAIVARACERLGGRCGVESKPGEGSRFWVEFPGV